jgi:hypothetical protein
MGVVLVHMIFIQHTSMRPTALKPADQDVPPSLDESTLTRP